MDEGAKRRLVGAAVLVALVVIFVPMLMEDSDRGDLGEPIVIPDEPHVEPAGEDEEAPTAGLTAEDLTPPLPIPEPPPGAIVEPPVAAPAPDLVPIEPEPPGQSQIQPQIQPDQPAGPQPVPPGTLSWVVQVASLGSPEAARGLQDRLRAKGYSAFVEQATVNGKRYYRVRVGPEVERARADSLAAQLQSETGNKPLVQRYP